MSDTLKSHPSPIVITAPWSMRAGESYELLGRRLGPGDEVTVLRGDITKIVTGHERAATEVARWLARPVGRSDDSG